MKTEGIKRQQKKQSCNGVGSENGDIMMLVEGTPRSEERGRCAPVMWPAASW